MYIPILTNTKDINILIENIPSPKNSEDSMLPNIGTEKLYIETSDTLLFFNRYVHIEKCRSRKKS